MVFKAGENLIEPVKTADGSLTLYVPGLNEHYHSTHGALNESQHVYIRHGLMEFAHCTNPLEILEVGFGTGLNALLTYRAMVKGIHTEISYHALEPFPLSSDLIEVLATSDICEGEEEQQFFRNIHEAEPNGERRLNTSFFLRRYTQKLQEFETEQKFDLIYFDAFAPRVQPELWEEAVFRKLYHLMKPGGILITYCAQGKFKRALVAAGFQVESLPGPAGKREITRGRKSGV